MASEADASADDGPGVDSRWPPSSRPTSASAPPAPILERHLAESERDETAAALARELVDAVVAHRDAIDAQIGRVAPQYPVDRTGPDGPRVAPNGHR